MGPNKKTNRRLVLAMIGGTAAGAAAGILGLDRSRGLLRRVIGSPRLWLKKLRRVPAPTFAAMPGGIVVHHSATKPEDLDTETAATIDHDHKRRGFATLYKGTVYHVAYHYVIGQDGTIERGRPERCPGQHTRSWKHNRWIGICLIGYFDEKWEDQKLHRPTKAQMESLIALSAETMKKYGFDQRRILPHRQVNDTECPGKSFPWNEYVAGLVKVINGEVAMNVKVSGQWRETGNKNGAGRKRKKRGNK